MTSNQNNRHYNLKEAHNPGGQAVVLEEDHLKGYVSAGATLGAFNETRLDYINKQLPGTYSNLCDAMAAFAASGDVASWADIGGKNTNEGPIPLEGKCAVGESGLTVTVAFDINIAGDASNGFTVYYEELGGRPIKTASIASGVISGTEDRLTIEGDPIPGSANVWVDYNSTTGSIKRADSAPTAVSFWGQRIPNGSQQEGAFDTGFGAGFD